MSTFGFGLASAAHRALAAGAWAILASHALAATESAPLAATDASSPDAMGRFLVEKGLIAPPLLAAPPAENPRSPRVREQASDLVLTAMNFLGARYRHGGKSAEQGFDCSGFTRQVFETSLGLVLPRSADEQASASILVEIQRDDVQPGDLVFFNTMRRTFSHVGIYIGDGKFIHAPRTGREVRIEDMQFAYWAQRFTGARRAQTVMDPEGVPLQPFAASPDTLPHSTVR